VKPARPPPAWGVPLHPDLRVLAQRGRELLLQDDPPAHPQWRVPLDRRPPGRHQPIYRYLKEHNDDPNPFLWTKPAEIILAKLARCLYLPFTVNALG
jgi:hypothetical protein